jgi:hypothetical protein
LGGYKRREVIHQEVHRPGMQVAGKDKNDGYFLENRLALSEMR